MGNPAIAAVRRVLSQNPKKSLVEPSLTPAGVLVLLYPKDGDYCILLNKRSASVENHKGEIAFPGGRKDGGDRTMLETALRETHEEMGVLPQDVDVLGELDDVPTRSAYLISPHVGTLPASYRFKPNDREVAEVLEVPVAELKKSANLRNDARIVDGKVVNRPSYAYQGHVIFGATAQVLTQFLELLDGAPDTEALWKKDQQ